MTEPTPRAIDLAEYVKQKDATRKVATIPLIHVRLAIPQTEQRAKEQEPQIIKAQQEIMEIMKKFNIFSIDAKIGFVEIDDA